MPSCGRWDGHHFGISHTAYLLPSLQFRQLDLAGDAAALESMLYQVKDGIYGLAIRMLRHPADAEDVTQEILMRIDTQPCTFEGRSGFRT